MQINLGSALAGAAQLFLTPATTQFACGSVVLQSRNMQRAKSAIAVAACTSAAPAIVEMAAVEMFTGPLSGSVCSPPHTTNFTRRALAPAHCIAPSKTRRRRRPFGSDPGDQDEDFGMPGGNDGDSGSTGGGGGGGDWGSDGEEEGGHFGDIASALWLWRALCVCSVLQVLHFMLLDQYKQANPAFATLSQSFFSSRIRSHASHAA